METQKSNNPLACHCLMLLFIDYKFSSNCNNNTCQMVASIRLRFFIVSSFVVNYHYQANQEMGLWLMNKS